MMFVSHSVFFHGVILYQGAISTWVKMAKFEGKKVRQIIDFKNKKILLFVLKFNEVFVPKPFFSINIWLFLS